VVLLHSAHPHGSGLGISTLRLPLDCRRPHWVREVRHVFSIQACHPNEPEHGRLKTIYLKRRLAPIAVTSYPQRPSMNA
jgi:hypothetical protein